MNGFDIKNYDGYEIDNDTFKLKKDLDLNGYSLKNFDAPGYEIENNTFKLKKDLDLNGYTLKNFQPRIIITGEWIFGQNVGGNRTYVKFGNSVNMMTPFPCLLGGISALITEKKDNSKAYDRIGFNFNGGLHGLLSDGPFQSVRNAGGLKYQYAEPHGGNEKLNLDDDFSVYLSGASSASAGLSNTKRALVSLILIDDYDELSVYKLILLKVSSPCSALILFLETASQSKDKCNACTRLCHWL